MSEVIRIDLNGVNCYLVKGEKGFILFDTGGPLVLDKTFDNRRDELLKQLSANGCSNGCLSLIVLTHGDCDHIYNAAYIRESFKAKIAMHSGDKALTEKPNHDNWMKSFNFKPFIMKLASKPLKAVFNKPIQKALDNFTTFSYDIELTDGFGLNAYGLDAKTVAVPGHTDGSVAILLKNGGLIAGDTFSNNKKPSPAANAVNFKQMYDSIEKLKNFNIKTVYPGHGSPFEFA